MLTGYGEVTEWLKVPVLKTGRLTPRGFESHPLRHFHEDHFLHCLDSLNGYKCLSLYLWSLRYKILSDKGEGETVLRLELSLSLFGEDFKRIYFIIDSFFVCTSVWRRFKKLVFKYRYYSSFVTPRLVDSDRFI